MGILSGLRHLPVWKMIFLVVGVPLTFVSSFGGMGLAVAEDWFGASMSSNPLPWLLSLGGVLLGSVMTVVASRGIVLVIRFRQ